MMVGSRVGDDHHALSGNGRCGVLDVAEGGERDQTPAEEGANGDDCEGDALQRKAPQRLENGMSALPQVNAWRAR